LLLNAPRGLLMVRDELAAWLGNFGRYSKGGNGGGESAKWLELHGGRTVMVDRKTVTPGMPRTIYIPRAAVSIAGGIQPDILRRALVTEYRESGLAARMLLAYPPQRLKRWTDAVLDPHVEEAMNDTFARLFAIPFDTDDAGELKPGIVRLDPDARQAWIAFYNAHALEHSELSGELSAAWSKLEGYAARLALVVHLTRWAANDPSLRDIATMDAESIAAGVRLSNWFGNEAKRVYAMLAEDDDDRTRRDLMDLIRRKGGAMTTRDLMRCCRQFSTATDAETAMDDLARSGWGCWQEVNPDNVGGRPTRRLVLLDAQAADATPTNTEKN
jgi:hypothetical protein